MTTTLFISDLHLQADEPDIAQGFLDYLNYRASKAHTLYILGDLFEGWIGDDACGPFENRMIDALRTLSNQGTRIFVMHGNRDFLLGQDFARMAGATLIDDPQVIHLSGQPVLLMHGDSLCTRDEDYMRFRAMARNPQWQAGILEKSVEERLALARQLRQQSGEANSNKAEDIMDVTPEEVEQIMAQHQVQTLIHGHTHRPDEHDVSLDGKTGRRLVLGDWKDNTGWELRHDDTDLILESFSLSDLPH
ncbi:UDP-2,3-diacylglucosamine diphosphatase [Larsenimonas rhizosphaerae]|uniref:UDP-2,3-diacylglucosamine hydrolase n=1 Tax=Larsenimonas rhizosphaerae TaxID=2944682 RepID=A0AA41ZCZ4_9GAMM|nr:UDP-2,3-diacylglucosamine diphosphatase [Larsenimonas rhizosphaerae]MCX2523052.1 UDP-2,3-diacylglucosamine diphosphatase [Larsenimonas rhizosphaerae]